MKKKIVFLLGLFTLVLIVPQATFAASCSALCSSQNLEGACDSLDTCIRSDDGTCALAHIRTRIDQASDCETVCYCYEVKEVEDPCIDVKPIPTVEPTIEPTLEPTVEPTPTDTPSEECDPHTVECPQTWTFMIYLLTAADEQTTAKKAFDSIAQLNTNSNPILRCSNIVAVKRHSPLNQASNQCKVLRHAMGDFAPTVRTETCPDLSEFIINSQNASDSHNYSLSIMGHGMPDSGIGVHSQKRSPVYYTHRQMGEIINNAVSATGRRINIVEHESCSTGVIENSFEFGDNVDYFIASPNVKVMKPSEFFAERFSGDRVDPCSSLTPNDMAGNLADTFCDLPRSHEVAINSTYNLQYSTEIQKQINDFYGELGRNCNSYKTCSLNAVRTAQRYEVALALCRNQPPLCNLQPNVDLIDLTRKILSSCAGLPTNQQSTGNSLIQTAINMTNANCLRGASSPRYNYSNAHGIAVYIPRNLHGYSKNSTQFTRVSDGWWSFLQCVTN